MDKFVVMQGTALPITATIAAGEGASLAGRYDGSEALDACAWPGGNRPAAFALAVAWADADAAEIEVTITPAQTASLAPGRHRGSVGLVDPELGRVEAYTFAFEVLAAPGAIPTPDPDAPAPPPVYCDLADVLDGRPWLRDLQDDEDEGGFARSIGKASRWLDELILNRAPRSFGGPNLGDPGYGARSAGAVSGPSPYLRRLLDGGALVVSDWVRECVAMRAAHLILNGKIGPGSEVSPYQALAAKLKAQSYNLANSRTAELRTGGPGSEPTLFFHLGSGSLR